MSKNLVIVESPAKAKTIEKYLGKDFTVLSSVGHIRKDTKVDPEHDFAVTYEIDPDHTKVVRELKKAAKSAETIWLATDEDREGESISWHLMEVLNLPADTHRITFHEITKPALEAAIKSPRTVDMNMVSSQQARQSLDMLVGYDLSGVIRRKVPGAKSAGRVQSPAVKLVVEKEREIEKFDKTFNFKVTGEFSKALNASEGDPQLRREAASDPAKRAGDAAGGTPTSASEVGETAAAGPAPSEAFSALLNDSPTTEKDATELLNSLASANFFVSKIDKSEGTRANPTPLTTAALQIEASSKLGYSASTTMRAAQALYQAGLITYHRTDSLNLSNQALTAMADYIKQNYGNQYLKTRHFKTKSAGAQEAHEAIRPTDITKTTAGKNDYERKLYQLIWSRTLATQMANAKVDKTTIEITGKISEKASEGHFSPLRKRSDEPRKDGREERPEEAFSLIFTAKGEIVTFDGFLRVYGKSKDLELPDLTVGDHLIAGKITARQTFAKPPARYTEGSLVKKLEELGIGRPSTYASILTAIQARDYVRKGEGEGRERDVIELVLKRVRGANEHSIDEPDVISTNTHGKNSVGSPACQVRSEFLPTERCENDYGANQLCSLAPLTLSKHIVREKSGATKGKLLPTPIGELIADFLTDHFTDIVDYGFTAGIETKLDQIAEHKLDRVKMLREFYTPFSKLIAASDDIERYNNATKLGDDPATGKPIYAKIGKNGGFIQLGDNEKESGEKPRFAPLPKGKTVKTVTFKQALEQLALPALPRSLGKADDGTELIAAAGPFGPYLKAGKYNIQLKNHDPYTITLTEAAPLYQEKLDSIIADWGDIMIIRGAYGPYIKGPGRRNNLKIPKDEDPTKITREEAEKRLAEKPKTTRRAPRKRKTTASKKNKKTKS